MMRCTTKTVPGHFESPILNSAIFLFYREQSPELSDPCYQRYLEPIAWTVGTREYAQFVNPDYR